jgi:basic membrane protein A
MSGKVINDFLVGYIQGAKDARPDVKVAVSMVGNYEDSAKGKDLSLAMFNAGADSGFNVAGSAGMGLIEAAKETGKLAFGVDSDQAALLPDYAANIPTSALKNVGAALKIALTQDMEGSLAYGTQAFFGFAEGGVCLVKDAHYEEMVPEEIRLAVDDLENKITDGEIEVYSSSTMTTEEIEALKASVALQ